MASKREKLEKKLTEQGIEFTPELSDDELQALLDANKKQSGDESEKTEITLRARSNHNGSANTVRTFSLAEHGEDFLKLAEDWKAAYSAEEVK